MFLSVGQIVYSVEVRVRRLNSVLLFAILLLSATASSAEPLAPNLSTAGKTPASREPSISMSELERRVSVQEKLLEAEGDRVQDIGYSVDRFGVLLTVFASLFTLVALVLGAAAWWSAGQRARDAAREWMDEHDAAFKKDLESKLAEFQSRLTETLAQSQRQAEEKTAAYLSALNEAKRQADLNLQSGQAPSPEEKKVLERGTQALRQKAEGDLKAEDWQTRAYDAFSAGRLALAAEYFRNAADAGDASEEVRARSLLNRGLLLGRDGKHEGAIEALRQVVAQYSHSTNESVREHVAKALVNTGVALLKTKKHEEAAGVFEDVITRYRGATELHLRQSVADAKEGKGLCLIFGAKAAWPHEEQRVARLREAVQNFAEAEPISTSRPTVWANTGYALFLLDRRKEAKDWLKRALIMEGKPMYDDEIEDSTIHEIPIDTEFRNLLKEVFEGIQA